ncbi:MAG: conjugative transposon protein TraM [Draconibacterium sp.]
MKTWLKKNKALLLLPLALIPFVVLIFYILGGGKNAEKEQKTTEITTSGINYVLPEADKSITIFDKMEAYEQQVTAAATTDYNILEATDTLAETTPIQSRTESESAGSEAAAGTDPSENLLAHIRDKETSIKKELEQGQEATDNQKKAATGKAVTKDGNEGKSSGKNGVNAEEKKQDQQEVQRQTLTTGIAELDKVFDENLELSRQNDSLQFYLKQASSRLQEIEAENSRKFTVSKKGVSGFGTNQSQNGSQVIKAEIYETATVLDGNRVKLRLLEEAWVNGIKVPQGSIVYGVCAIRNERLNISITQFPARESFLTVDLAVHDVDGLPGLYVPDNAARKATKDALAGTNTSSMIGVTNDPLTYAGIRAADRTAQTLLKSIRLKRVTVKKNTIVYIINQKTKS